MVRAGNPNRTFSPTTSTLIFGARDAVLVDAPLIRKDVDALGDTIASTGRALATIFITHGHGDHFFGSDRLIARFPGARAVTTPGIVDYGGQAIAHSQLIPKYGVKREFCQVHSLGCKDTRVTSDAAY